MARAYAILGPSGMGKSTSLRNMKKDEVYIINTERKTLPFPNHKDYHQIWAETTKEVFDTLSNPKLIDSTKIKAIVIDSFSAFSDMLVAEARILRSGWDVWMYYAEMLQKLFKLQKALVKKGKDVIMICHDETISGEDTAVKRIKVKGKEWEGLVEKEFDVVLWAAVRVVANAEPDYLFKTRTDGKIPAKAPMGYLPPEVPNDLQAILDIIRQKDA